MSPQPQGNPDMEAVLLGEPNPLGHPQTPWDTPKPGCCSACGLCTLLPSSSVRTINPCAKGSPAPSSPS